MSDTEFMESEVTIESLRDDMEQWRLDSRAKRVAYARKYWAFGVPEASSAPDAPGQVIDLAASNPTTSTMDLTWSAPISGGTPSNYIVEYKVHTDSTWTTVGANITLISYTVTGLDAATSYDFRVKAHNQTGTGAVSSTVTETTNHVTGGNLTTDSGDNIITDSGDNIVWTL